MPACPHYPSRHSLHAPNFEGAIAALVDCIYTISGVGTTSFTIDPSGYASNFEGLVQCIEDLNFTMSGISAGGGGSGTLYTAGSGLYLSNGTEFNINFDNVFQNSVSGHIFGEGNTSILYSGNSVIISGAGGGGGAGGAGVIVGTSPGVSYSEGSLWFDTLEGRLFVYASGYGSSADWYQTNAEALVYKSEVPPSGAGDNAPPRDGSLWFNTLLGSLFVYDATTSGWYEAGPTRGISYGTAAPTPGAEGALWVNSETPSIKVWDGSSWVSV